jgi:hypothetical protein
MAGDVNSNIFHSFLAGADDPLSSFPIFRVIDERQKTDCNHRADGSG